MNDSQQLNNLNGLEIAIIGMACRFPGAENIAEFWQNLKDGKETITFFNDRELEKSGIDPALIKNPNYVKAGGILEDIESFDASFFGYSPKEAEVMDPQQRLFLELAWQALEDAGYDANKYDGLIGVFAGAGTNGYLFNLYSNRDISESVEGFEALIGNASDHLCTRVSYKLNLQGPSVAVQTACSTSLVAVHLASQSLLSSDCDMALAGGVSLHVPQKTGHLTQEGWIISPDGHCRAFDARANGTVNGSGLGIVVLKRLTDAIKDRDYIHAVIKGSAINNDGSSKIGYTAPRIEGQAAVIRAAQLVAEVDAGTITYIETHGTGTELGDPIEVSALTQAFRETTDKCGFCAIGSVKTNFGHIDTAAGVAGLIKTVLSLEHKLLPPSLHFQNPNPNIDFENSPFYVNNKLSEWKSAHAPRRAGVSSFGIGGTNVHVILEEAAESENPGKSRPLQLLLLSAKTNTALETSTDNMARHLKEYPAVSLADVAYTFQTGRRAFDHRRALVCRTVDEAVRALETRNPKRIFSSIQEHDERPVVFMFPGQGAQYVNMGLELYKAEPVFGSQVDRCFEILKNKADLDLKELLYPESTGEHKKEKSQQLDQTVYTQPALFVIEYAMARLLMSWGVQPQAMIGHSIGEYVAACLAGVFSLENALMLIAERGRLMQSLPGGSMLSVPLPGDKIQPMLTAGLSVAAINGPSLCAVSGPTDAIDTLHRHLSQQKLDCTPLHTSHAFHSEMMEPIIDPFTDKVNKVNLKVPSIPFLSNLTGTWISEKDAVDPSYWARHLRQTVRFADNLEELLKDPDQILLEVGPGRTLSALARQHPGKKTGQAIFSTIPHPKEPKSDEASLFETLGRLWLAGAKVSWHSLYNHEKRQRLPLPTYPFERKRYWVELKKKVAGAKPAKIESNKQGDITDWFYRPVWETVELPTGVVEPQGFPPCWIVFCDGCGFGEKMVSQLREEGQKVVTVKKGKEFQNPGHSLYTINPESKGDYEILIKEFSDQFEPPWKIVHLWGVTAIDSTPDGKKSFKASQYSGFYSLLFLAQALGKQKLTDPLPIWMVTNNMQKVADEKVLFPEKSTILGPCKVIPKEYSGISCHSIDMIIPPHGSDDEKRLINDLVKEIKSRPSDTVVAFRNNQRFIQNHEAVRLGGENKKNARLKEGGVYLISGGLGGMGLTFSDYLARTIKAKLVLIDQFALPEREEWNEWLSVHDSREKISKKIRAVQALEELNSEVLVAEADITSEEQMREVVARAVERFGGIQGVIHAAGVPGGGMIQRRTQVEVEEVFAPKIMGLYVLDSVLKDVKLDFMVLCSSLTAILGELGQVDYCAANIFLDKFALYHASSGFPFTISINWDTWKEVGMAVEAATVPEPQQKKIPHPLLETCLEENSDRVVFAARLSVEKHWVLSEHRINDIAVLPGTAYVEMARAAFKVFNLGETVQIGNIFFQVPLLVKDDEIRMVHTIINRSGDEFGFIIKSRPLPDEDDETLWQEHARGSISPSDKITAETHDIDTIKKKCGEKEFSLKRENKKIKDGFQRLGFLTFGPRWQSLLKEVTTGKNCALALLELPESFASDLENYGLHPALLDTAASFAVIDKGDYLPFSYRNMVIYRSLPREVYSYIHWKGNNGSQKSTLHFELKIIDKRGKVIAEVEDYTLRKSDEGKLKLKGSSPEVDDSPKPREGKNYCLKIISPGILDTLTLDGCQRREPGPGEVEIKVNHVGLNFKDVLMALTLQTDHLSPEITKFGSECSGKITAVGKGVDGIELGDEVIVAAPDCFRVYLTASASLVVPKPADLSFEEAATIPIAFMTARYALHHLGRLCRGECVLIHAAAGGVGMAAVKYAQKTGAEIFATAGSPEKREFLRSLGIKYIMNSRTLDFADEVMEYTKGKGVDVILNSLAGEFMVKSLSVLAPFGRFLEIGKRDIYQAGEMNLKPFQKGLAFFSVNLSPQLPIFRPILQEVMQAFKEGTLSLLPFKIFPLKEVKQAFDYMAQAKHIGKIVISMQVEHAPILQALGKRSAASMVKKDEHVFTISSKQTLSNLLNLEDGILSQEGMEVFRRVLSAPLPQVVISTRPLKDRLEEQQSLDGERFFKEMEKFPGGHQERHSRPVLETEYIPPRNKTEQILSEIWQEVLGIDQVGVFDNFFDLGGASLQSIQVVAKAKEAGIKMTPELLFEFQTISELMESISDKSGTDPDEQK